MQLNKLLVMTVGVLSGLFLSSVAFADPDVERWEPSIVRVWNDTVGGRGTGWMLNNESYIVTNEHVVSGGRDFSIQLPGTNPDQSMPAELIWADARLDLAVLRVPGYQETPFKLHVEDPPRGSRVYTAGYPGLADDAAETLTNRISIYGGTVALSVDQPRTNRRIIQHDNIVNAGNSGGPLLDECGRVMGITSYGRESEGIQADFIWYSVHVVELQRELDRLGIAYEVDNSSCAASTGGGASSGGVSDSDLDAIEQNVGALEGEVGSLDSEMQSLARFMKAYGALLAGGFVILLILVLRKPRERIVRVIEKASVRIKESLTRPYKRKPSRSPVHPQGAAMVFSGRDAKGKSIRISVSMLVLESSGNGLSFGRDKALVDFALLDDRVSRRHARIGLEGDNVVLEDLNSTNGTFINGSKLAAYIPTEIEPGDKVRFGTLELTVSRQ